MRVYVAAKLEEREAVRQLHGVLAAKGHTVTLDWTQEPGLTGLSAENQHAQLEEWGQKEIDAVKSCDVFLQLPHPNSRGAYVELGMALALGKPALIIEPAEYIHCIFFHVQQSLFIDRASAFDAVRLDYALRGVAGHVPMGFQIVSPYGPEMPSIRRTYWRLDDKTVAVGEAIKAKVAAFMVIVGSAPLTAEGLKRVARPCGHELVLNVETLTDLESLHGVSGVEAVVESFEDCPICKIRSTE